MSEVIEIYEGAIICSCSAKYSTGEEVYLFVSRKSVRNFLNRTFRVSAELKIRYVMAKVSSFERVSRHQRARHYDLHH